MQTCCDNSKAKPIGILGGTFDPIHFGHIHLANSTLNELALAIIHFIPCYNPPHRNKPIATPQHRLAMLKIALQKYPQLIIDTREITRQGTSYMIDTLISLRKELPLTPLCLIMGIDAFTHLTSWHKWQKLLDYCHIIVANRPDSSYNTTQKISDRINTLLQRTQTTNPQDLVINLAGKIFFITIIPRAISATNIRKQLKQQQKPADIPENVYQYIIKHGVYL